MSDDSGRPSAPRPQGARSRLVAGIGLRASASASDVLELLDACLAAVHARRADLAGLATLDLRSTHPQLLAVAGLLELPLLPLSADRLDPAAPNPSSRVADLAGVPSVAEAAALAFGPLVLAKQRSANVTCALARYSPADRSSAPIAASTLATSSAGP